MLDRDVIVCFSHLRWDFVQQRPQHLMERCARHRQVIFVEEPVEHDGERRLELTETSAGVIVAVPHLSRGMSGELADAALRALFADQLERLGIEHPILWFYTPMSIAHARHLRPRLIVYDCMDELSLFKDAPAILTAREQQLMSRADVVFTGGHALYEHKRGMHPNIHPFPSSVDVPHFARARFAGIDPVDQAPIPRPRAGFYGVIDERMDLELLADLADRRPDLHLVIVGPVAKIDPSSLPRRPNLHWLGSKTYADLPDYLAGWDVAILPFARNPATRFISPTKTPEYMAAGRPVVSTSIRDVVRPYGERGLARIADDPASFAAAIDAALAEDPAERQARFDEFLADLSWDRTWSEMWARVEETMTAREGALTGVRRAAGGGALAGAASAEGES